MPLATGILIGPVVAFPRKINPFRMTEFVAHKIEIAGTGGGQGDQADHLVQRHTAVHTDMLIIHLHMIIHIRID